MPSLLWRYAHFTEGFLMLMCLKRKENVSGGKNQMWLSLGKWVTWQWNPRNSMQINAGSSSRMCQDCALLCHPGGSSPGLFQGQAKPPARRAQRGQSPARTQPQGCPPCWPLSSLAQSPTGSSWGWGAPGKPCLAFLQQHCGHGLSTMVSSCLLWGI